MPGPPPKRSSQRRRRNRVTVDKAATDSEVRGPELRGRHSAVARRFYDALRRSGQAQFFEASDWAAAELAVAAIDAFMREPSAALLSAINTSMSNLLTTEADRRRLRLELVRPDEEEEGLGDVPNLDDFRRRALGQT